jgi:hypothetical protein
VTKVVLRDSAMTHREVLSLPLPLPLASPLQLPLHPLKLLPAAVPCPFAPCPARVPAVVAYYTLPVVPSFLPVYLQPCLDLQLALL